MMIRVGATGLFVTLCIAAGCAKQQPSEAPPLSAPSAPDSISSTDTSGSLDTTPTSTPAIAADPPLASPVVADPPIAASPTVVVPEPEPEVKPSIATSPDPASSSADDSSSAKIVKKAPPAAVDTKPEPAKPEPATKSVKKPSNPNKRPAGLKLDRQALTFAGKRGEELWNDKTRSERQLSCSSCHSENRVFKSTFAEPYPHEVALVKKKVNLTPVDVDEMVNFCLSVSMKARMMDWNSDDLLSLSAYVLEKQKSFVGQMKN